MSDDQDYPRSRVFFANPHRTVGRQLWILSRSRAKHAGIIWFAVGVLAFISLGLVAASTRGAVSLLFFVAGLASLFAFVVVAEFAGEVLCPSCEYPQRATNHYCPACGAEVDETDV